MMTNDHTLIYTIGHSDHDIMGFMALLMRHNIKAVIDARPRPASRKAPWFNAAPLASSLKTHRIAYSYAGQSLGQACQDAGETGPEVQAFEEGIDEAIRMAQGARVAILRKEPDPLHCTRTLVVTRELTRRNVSVVHITRRAQAVPHARLVKEARAAGTAQAQT